MNWKTEFAVQRPRLGKVVFEVDPTEDEDAVDDYLRVVKKKDPDRFDILTKVTREITEWRECKTSIPEARFVVEAALPVIDRVELAKALLEGHQGGLWIKTTWEDLADRTKYQLLSQADAVLALIKQKLSEGPDTLIS